MIPTVWPNQVWIARTEQDDVEIVILVDIWEKISEQDFAQRLDLQIWALTIKRDGWLGQWGNTYINEHMIQYENGSTIFDPDSLAGRGMLTKDTRGGFKTLP